MKTPRQGGRVRFSSERGRVSVERRAATAPSHVEVCQGGPPSRSGIVHALLAGAVHMTIPAKSVMTTDIVTVSPETTVVETARRMLIHHVSAVPVVDPDNRPLGLVSEGDVMRHFSAQFQSKRAQWLRLLAEGETLARSSSPRSASTSSTSAGLCTPPS